MANGNYDYSFYFYLPQGIPSSLFFKDKHIEAKPSLKIKYSIKAHLDIKGMKDVKYKHTLMVREPCEALRMDESHRDRDKIVTCCCCD